MLLRVVGFDGLDSLPEETGISDDTLTRLAGNAFSGYSVGAVLAGAFSAFTDDMQ